MLYRLPILGTVIAGFVAAFAAFPEHSVAYEIIDLSIPAPLAAAVGNPTQGRDIVIEPKLGNCLACHKIPDLGDQPFHGNLGPSLASVAKRYTEGELRLHLVDPKQIYPNTIMPAFYRSEGFNRVPPEFTGKTILTAEQIEHVVAFLLTLDEEDDTFSTPQIHVATQPTTVKPQADNPLPALISGYEFAIEDTKATQDNDFANPGFFWVNFGKDSWDDVEGDAGKACASCHGVAEDTMPGVGATYPKYHEGSGRPINLEQRINICRAENMEAEAWPWESDELLAMTAYLKNLSRGFPVDVKIDGKVAPFFARGEALFYRRLGQLDMSCAHCHEATYGRHLRANVLTQGHINGFPAYRFRWQGIGSLQRRFPACMTLVRAIPYAPGADEHVDLELYLAWRGNGLKVETPAVRQ